MRSVSFLSLSNSPWSYPYWTSRQFLMYELARLAPVGYATGRTEIREWSSLRRLLSFRKAAPFPAPAQLRVLPSLWPRTYRFDRIDRRLRQAYLSRLQRELDHSRAECRVIYAWNPGFLDVVRALEYDVLIYHPYDMFRHFGAASVGLVDQEEEMCRMADAVVTPHGRVAETLKHPNTRVINNGVFLPAFPDFRTLQPASILEGLSRPLIGYVGAINDKLDFPLLHGVFSARPEWQLALVGFEGPGEWKESAAYEELRRLPNVRYLGGVPIDQVAPVIAGFDVGIIPYSLSGWAQYSESPLKLYQYWAMGVPAVCSALPNLEPRPGALRLCTGAGEWERGIAVQLGERGESARSELRRRAKDNDWASKAHEVMDLVRSL